jgi:hypothetical protein
VDLSRVSLLLDDLYSVDGTGKRNHRFSAQRTAGERASQVAVSEELSDAAGLPDTRYWPILRP